MQTALRLIKENQQKALVHLVKEQGQLLTTMYEGKTLLHYAATQNIAFGCTLHLLNLKADPNIQDEQGLTPLFDATAHNAYFSISCLLNAGATPSVTCPVSGNSLLHVLGQSSADQGSLLSDMTLRSLLSHLSIHTLNNRGETLLFQPHILKKRPLLNLLCQKKKADPNWQDAQGNTPLHVVLYAANEHFVQKAEIVQVLLNNSANLSIRNHAGKTPLMVALSKAPQPATFLHLYTPDQGLDDLRSSLDSNLCLSPENKDRILLALFKLCKGLYIQGQ